MHITEKDIKIWAIGSKNRSNLQVFVFTELYPKSCFKVVENQELPRRTVELLFGKNEQIAFCRSFLLVKYTLRYDEVSCCL